MEIAKEAKNRKDAAAKNAKKIVKDVKSAADNTWKELNTRAEDVSAAAKARSAGLAVRMVKMQRSAFDRAIKLLAQAQKQGDKLLKQHIEDASWMPPEGTAIVKEWSRALSNGRDEFQKVVDRSCDLLQTMFERVEKQAKSDAKSADASKTAGGARKKSPAKKKSARRKTAPKAAASEKATPAA
ncbi:MAG TPA: hypothetical protein P5318_02075 [Candidatus Hydrogenedentes bacterium]|nr:hypothetical protein [Candidatus Hydrogenedentota bacterium]HPC16130.1 hypothetical protein [Candidatus Hydrogenedentota bacterium]HRT18888.1 hypothetical protein [Candidatus Hydrogenedentota bacterium]HRT65613.1 hypothetical protein [Candidatus Hydrogenedentota bacterium]